MMARGHALGPSKVRASQGATTQANAAIGRAAEAQVPRTRAREYWGNCSASSAVSGSAVTVLSVWVVFVMTLTP
jgi:hypothetical protein